MIVQNVVLISDQVWSQLCELFGCVILICFYCDLMMKVAGSSN